MSRRKPLAYLALFTGFGLYLYSAYYRLRFGFTQEYARILILSLFVVMVGLLLFVVFKLKSETQSGKPRDIKAIYFFLIAGFSALLILSLHVESIIPDTVALSLLLGLFVLVAPFVLVFVMSRLRDAQRIGRKEDGAMSPAYYYLGLIAIVIFVLIVIIQLVRYLQ